MIPGVLIIVLSFSFALALVIFTIPPIIRVAKAKKLFDTTNERKVHTSEVPAIGGVAIFIGFTLSAIISSDGYNFDSFKYILAAIIILFFVGLKDDILIISARKKFVIQLVAALMLILLGDIRITNLQWVFWINEISYPVSVFITLLFIVVTINAYNLIDGIDGLASGLGILSSAVFGTWFYLAGDIHFAVMSFALSGSLAGFFVFNVFGKKNKLFMGDSGSLIMGLIFSVLVIRFVEINRDQSITNAIYSSPAVAFAILIVPLFDGVRVFLLRLSQKRSPFYGDKSHIHHEMLKLLPSHLSITAFIILANGLIILSSFYMSRIRVDINVHLLILLGLGIFFTLIPIFLNNLKKEEPANQKKSSFRLALRTLFFS